VSIGGYSLQAFSCSPLGNSGTKPIPLSEGPTTSLRNVGDCDCAVN
jgi:hypothetical protein